ncbi:MAG: hypothetical protein WD689_04745 [Gaiellaceae bacterium]
MGRAASVLIVAGLAAWYVYYDELPTLPTGANVALVSAVLLPATFALVWLALPMRDARGLPAVGAALAILAAVWHVADWEIAANFAKLGAATAVAWWFLAYFERLSWVVAVAAAIPFVDAISVWRGPTQHIVTERPQLFDALSYGIPVPHEVFALGLPDILFFALFLAAAARWRLRVGATWAAMLLSFGITIVLAVWTDPFGIGGLPALPGLSLAFLAVNGDLLLRQLRRRPERE